MRRRMRIWTLLDQIPGQGRPPKVKIIGSATGQVLYEGCLFSVPFGLCSDYVEGCRILDGVLQITSTTSMYESEGTE